MTSTFVDAAQSCLTNSLSHYPKNPEGLQMADFVDLVGETER
jgi:hypothetical protein